MLGIMRRGVEGWAWVALLVKCAAREQRMGEEKGRWGGVYSCRADLEVRGVKE